MLIASTSVELSMRVHVQFYKYFKVFLINIDGVCLSIFHPPAGERTKKFDAGGLHIVHITNSLTRRKRVALFLSIAVLVATVVGLKHPDT